MMTIVLDYTSDRPTVWHPTESTGPFASLCRGSFATEEAARVWARANIPGYAYRLVQLTDITDDVTDDLVGLFVERSHSP